MKLNLNFEGAKIENAVRNSSKKKTIILDLADTTSWHREEDKLFYGRETKKKLEISRIKPPIGRFLPNLIIKFNKTDFQNPTIRLGFFGYFFMVFLMILFIALIIRIILDKSFNEDVIYMIVITLLSAGLFFIEYSLTKLTLNKLIKRIENQNS